MSTCLFLIWYFIKKTNNYVWQQTRSRASRCRAVRASTRRTRSRRLPRFGRSRLGRPLSSSLKRWFFCHHDCNQYYHHRDKTALFPCILLLFVTKTPCQEVVGYMQFFLPITWSKSAKCKIPHWWRYLSSFYLWDVDVIESFDNQYWTSILLCICEDPYSP